MTFRKVTVVVTAGLMCLATAMTGQPSTLKAMPTRPVYEPTPQSSFLAIVLPTYTPAPIAIATAQPHPQPPQPKAKVQSKAKAHLAIGTQGQSVGGIATYYCCTRGFTNNDLVAAAGPALRIGHWRGRLVTVTHIVVAAHKQLALAVRVRLVDWCACGKDRVIDLSTKAFTDLGMPLSRGIQAVTVSW